MAAQHGLWRRSGPLTVGPRLTELVQERLARVSRNEMATLELVAFGDPVPLSVVTRLAPSVYVSSLQRQGLAAVETAHGEEQVRPAHPVYGEVIRAALPAPRARDLRGELATAFEAGGRIERPTSSGWCRGGSTPPAMRMPSCCSPPAAGPPTGRTGRWRPGWPMPP